MIVLARKVQDQKFVEMTGKYHDTPLFEDIWKAEALVYSSNDLELSKARDFAKTEGYSTFILPDTEDVLSVAKQMILENKKQPETAVTETREAWIPTSMIPEFKGRVTELNKRATRLKCDPISYDITSERDTIRIPAEQFGGYVKPGFSYEVTKINITGTTPIIPGFQVVAKIDHDAELDQNIIIEFGGKKLPDDYRHKDGDCDHCGIKRQRNKTYILLDTESDVLSQVGSSCLKDFTGHSNPENVCRIREFMDDCMGELSEFGSESSKSGYIKVEPFLDIVAQCTLQYGYVTAAKAEEQCVMSTGDTAMQIYKDGEDVKGKFIISQEAKDLAAKATEYIKSLDRDKYDNYSNNIITFVENGMVKDKYHRMLASSIQFYNNEQYKLRKVEDSSHKTFIGTKEEKHTFEAIHTGHFTTQNDFGIVHINKFNDDNGNNITWFTNSNPNLQIDERYAIEATVKDHKTYNQEPLTVITRPKFKLMFTITEEEISTAKTIADQVGDYKGMDAINAYTKKCEEQPVATDSEKTYIYGIGNIYTYLNDPQLTQDKLAKTLQQLNTHQMFLLAQSLQKSGFTVNNYTEQTKKFFKVHSDAVDKIKALYPIQKAVKTKSR